MSRSFSTIPTKKELRLLCPFLFLEEEKISWDKQRRKATPIFADQDAIRKIYEDAAKITLESGIPHNVDHIVPLRSKIVCGLHCETNLRIIPKIHNISKGNRYWPNMP